MDQKMMKMLGGIIAVFVVFILILFGISSCSGGSYTYEKLEAKMLSVAKDYYKNNEDDLPSQDKDTSTYTLKKMISDERIEELSKLFDKEDIKCDGNVTVTNNNGYYLYSTYLSCGKDYETKYLKDKIIEDSLVVDNNGVGLYESGDEYVMKGEVKNNYISFNGAKYRIIKINEDESIRVIAQDGMAQKKWDDRYNENVTVKGSGINEYILENTINSRIKQTLQDYYDNEDVWSEQAKAYIPTQTLCIGKRSASDITKDGSTECSVKIDNQTFGLLAIYEYLQMSLDSDCTSTTDKSCRNYNWITSIDKTLWTITADAEASNKAYSIYKQPSTTSCSTLAYANIVFNLDSSIAYQGGTGTVDDPYVINMPEN